MPNDNPYQNQPYICQVRVSDYGDKQNSDEAQLKWLKDWANERLMVHVDDFVENDLSGSLPGNRSDMQKILERADQFGDFKYVLTQRVDRATRGGADHYFWFEHELKRRGIKLLSPGDGLPDNVPFKNTLVAAKADAAQEAAAATGQRSAQGSQYALEARRVSPHSHTPFGCYRLYCRPDATPLHVIVDKRNGQQEKRSWPDLALIDTYGDVGGGKVGHYKKQKSELVYLIPGDPYEHETVIMIFIWRYLDGLSAVKIAQRLNDEGRPAPRGGKWAEGQVSNIYNNEDYTARGIANRTSAARYARRHTKGPQKVEHDDKTLTTASSLKPILRSQEDWFEGTEPYLIDFLKDENLREIAMAKQKAFWARRMDPTWNPKNRKKHNPGPYLLHPLLKCQQRKESLVGSVSGRKGHPVQIYRHPELKRNPMKGSIFGRVFNAQALHKGVLDVLKETILDWPDIEARLLAHAQEQVSKAQGNGDALAAKQQQREEVRDQLLLFVRSLTKKTQDDLAPEIRRLESQRDQLDAEIEMLKKQSAAPTVDPQAVVIGMKARLETLAKEVDSASVLMLMDVLAQFTDLLEADMETKEVEFAFVFPAWMLSSDAKTPLSQLCRRTNSEFSAGRWTQRDVSLFVPIAEGTCRFKRHQRSVICHCRRQRRVA